MLDLKLSKFKKQICMNNTIKMLMYHIHTTTIEMKTLIIIAIVKITMTTAAATSAAI